MQKTIYNFLRNSISKTTFFWKYRHYLQPEVWSSYKNDQDNLRRSFYSDFMNSKSLNSVFEYGCASGPNFFSINKKIDKLFFFGYDISKRAIDTISYDKLHKNHFFTNRLSLVIFKNFLKLNKLEYFELAIFDRVLYMIEEKRFRKLLNEYSTYFKYVVIDDFHSEIPIWDKEKYIYSKNYKKILNDFNFEVIGVKDSQIPSSTAKKYAKRLIFKNKNYD